MSNTETADTEPIRNHGWRVTFAGTGINLALGVLYSWSIFKGAIEKEFGWDYARLNDPYALCCLVFAFVMILAGKCQDKMGPRFTAFVGGVLVGAGLLIASRTTSYFGWLLGFGLLVGAGIGFGYSSATPPALKWFPKARTGLIAGLVVSGFGLASVYIAPLSEYLLRGYGVLNAMLFYSVLFTLAVCGLALLLRNPPPGFVAEPPPAGGAGAAPSQAVNCTPSEILRMPAFYVLWVVYFIGSGAGLMVISSVSGMARKSMGEAAFIAVAVMAIGNAAGRIVAGLLSDRMGRQKTLMMVLLIQAVLMFVAIPVTASHGGKVLIVLLATFIGFNYGANLSLFPSYTKDLWGLKSFGINYGILFTAWGVGGFALSRLQQMLKAGSGTYTSSFVTAGVLLVIGALLTLMIRTPAKAAAKPT